MLNPFAWPGPEFLSFYVLVAVVAHLVLAQAIRASEQDLTLPRPLLRDPYEIAYLRGGLGEALRVAAVSLVDRGFLTAKGLELVREAEEVDAGMPPIERQVLRFFATATKATAMLDDMAFRDVGNALQDRLEQLGLLVSPGQRSARFRLMILTGVVLIAVAAIKIAIALQIGRTNVGFLVVSAVGATILLKLHDRRRTALGNDLVADLREMFRGLSRRADRLRPGAGGDDLAYLVAVFGLAMVPNGNYPFVGQLFPKAKAGTGSDSGSGCGSSCGSSCSGGSSCGGGGGGGCGGCSSD